MKSRDRDILAMRDAGNSFRAIGAELGISATRANHLYHAARNKLRWKAEAPRWTDGLSVKVANALIAEGYSSKGQVVAGLQSGAIGLRPGSINGKIPGIAQGSITELSLWAGVETAQEQAIRAAITLLEGHGYKISRA